MTLREHRVVVVWHKTQKRGDAVSRRPKCNRSIELRHLRGKPCERSDADGRMTLVHQKHRRSPIGYANHLRQSERLFGKHRSIVQADSRTEKGKLVSNSHTIPERRAKNHIMLHRWKYRLRRNPRDLGSYAKHLLSGNCILRNRETLERNDALSESNRVKLTNNANSWSVSILTVLHLDDPCRNDQLSIHSDLGTKPDDHEAVATTNPRSRWQLYIRAIL